MPNHTIQEVAPNIQQFAGEGELLIKALKEHIETTSGVKEHFKVKNKAHSRSLRVSFYGLKILFRVELLMTAAATCRGFVRSYIVPSNKLKKEIPLGNSLKFPYYEENADKSKVRADFACQILAEVADGLAKEDFNLKLQ